MDCGRFYVSLSTSSSCDSVDLPNEHCCAVFLHYPECDVKILFVGEQAQFDAAVNIFEECEQLEIIVAMSADIDIREHSFAVSWRDFMAQAEAQQVELDVRLGSCKHG